MKEQNIIRIKCIMILLFIILSVVLIVVSFSQEYRNSSLFSGGIDGFIVSLYMLKTIWSVKASQRKREQLIIDETDERNLLIQENSRAQTFNVSFIATLAAFVLASLYHEEAISSCFSILLGIQLLVYLLIWTYYKRRLQLSISQACRMGPVIEIRTQSSKAYHVRSGSCRAASRILSVYKLIGCLYTDNFARFRNTLYSPKKMVL